MVHKAIKAPTNVQDALKVLRKEVEMRTSQTYLTATKKHIDKNECPPAVYDQEVQERALDFYGYQYDAKGLEKYRSFVKNMSVKDRSEIFFLKANDDLFKPEINPNGNSIVTALCELKGSRTKFTDEPLNPQDEFAYFIIAAPST